MSLRRKEQDISEELKDQKARGLDHKICILGGLLLSGKEKPTNDRAVTMGLSRNGNLTPLTPTAHAEPLCEFLEGIPLESSPSWLPAFTCPLSQPPLCSA